MKWPTQYYAAARRRAKRRRSPWNLLLFVFKWPLTAIWCIVLVKTVLWIPHHGALTFREAAQHDGPMLLIVLPLLCLSLILAMLTTNFLLFLIPPARRAFESEAGDDPKLHFAGTQKALLKVAGVVALVAVPTALLAAWRIEPQQRPAVHSPKRPQLEEALRSEVRKQQETERRKILLGSADRNASA